MGSPFFRTRSAPKAKCARGVMDLHRNFLFSMMILDIHLSGCSVYQKPFLNMYGSTRRYNLCGRVYMISSFFRFGRKVSENKFWKQSQFFLALAFTQLTDSC